MKDQIKPTPGPWVKETWKYQDPETGETDRSIPVIISTTRQLRIAAMDSDEGKDNPYTNPLAEAEANAQLMAAAPDLLEALKATREELRSLENRMAEHLDSEACRVLSEVHRNARAAIAKAEGETT